jgi:hypothetical protein
MLNNLLSVNVVSDVNSLWEKIATQPWPYGLAGPVSSTPPCGFFGAFYSVSGTWFDPAKPVAQGIAPNLPFFACSSPVPGTDNTVPPQVR